MSPTITSTIDTRNRREFNLNPRYMDAFLKGQFYPVHVVHYNKQS